LVLKKRIIVLPPQQSFDRKDCSADISNRLASGWLANEQTLVSESENGGCSTRAFRVTDYAGSSFPNRKAALSRAKIDSDDFA
jgi:hypothetical protein